MIAVDMNIGTGHDLREEKEGKGDPLLGIDREVEMVEEEIEGEMDPDVEDIIDIKIFIFILLYYNYILLFINYRYYIILILTIKKRNYLLNIMIIQSNYSAFTIFYEYTYNQRPSAL
jgi:hypothetical protein